MPHPLDLFHFCPRCGSSHFEVFDARAKRCADCGFTYYHNASASAVGVITDERGRVLLVRRRFDPGRGRLGFPGGFAEIGETLEACCRRELHEELGIEATVGPFLFSVPNDYLYSGFVVNTLDAYFRCTVPAGTVFSPGDDAAEVVWTDLHTVRPADIGLHAARVGVVRLREMQDAGGL